jgi:hypothetical protein
MDIIENEDARPAKVLEVLEVLEREKQIEAKIKEKQLYKKWPGSDTWACTFCNEMGDKWYKLEHLCKMNKNYSFDFFSNLIYINFHRHQE